MAVECAAFNAGPGDGNERGWVCWGDDGNVALVPGLWAVWSVPVVTTSFGPHFSLLGASELLII